MDLVGKAAGNPLAINNASYMPHFEGTASKLRGDYIGSIDRWKSEYPDEQLFVGFFDEIRSDPSSSTLAILAVPHGANRLSYRWGRKLERVRMPPRPIATPR